MKDFLMAKLEYAVRIQDNHKKWLSQGKGRGSWHLDLVFEQPSNLNVIFSHFSLKLPVIISPEKQSVVLRHK